MRWRKNEVEVVAESALTSGHEKIPFNSREWWACMVQEKLRNFDVARKRHHTDISSTPTSVSDLPAFCEPSAVERDETVIGGDVDASSEDSDCEDDKDALGEDVALADVDQRRLSDMSGRPPPVSALFGAMPSGCF